MAEGLVSRQTDLKSLKYSGPLGSRKPYITKDVNNPPSSNLTAMQVTKRVDDLSRIAQMLVTKPGIKYLGNEALLQQVDAQKKLQKARDGGKTLTGAVLQQLGATVISTTKIIGSTLAQVPLNGTGTHFLKGFRTDTYLRPDKGGKAPSAFASFFGAGGVEGAQYALRGKEVPNNIESGLYEEGRGVLKSSKYDYDENINQGILPSSREGLPGALAQQGTPITLQGPQWETTAQQYQLGRAITDVQSTEFLPYEIPNKSSYSQDNTYIEGSSSKNRETQVPGQDPQFKVSLNKVEDEEIFKGPSKVVSNFQSGSRKVYALDYSNRLINKETRVNLGNQGGRRSYIDYNSVEESTQDGINMLDILNDRANGEKEGRDLAKFYFEIITPEGSKFLHFRAFIESISDGYNADWQTHKYVGRAENFYTYGGFSRDIDISFTVAAATQAEMRPLYRKMLYLASSTAPTYGGDSNFMRGTVARITLGSYFSQIPGVITSVKFDWDKETPWEIAMRNPEGSDPGTQELPMVLKCSVSFKPIHDFAPQTGLQNYFTSVEGSKSYIK